LKYYIRRDELGNLTLDSIACTDDQMASVPAGFVEWFNKDEWDLILSKNDDHLSKADSPIAAMMFDGYLRRKAKA